MKSFWILCWMMTLSLSVGSIGFAQESAVVDVGESGVVVAPMADDSQSSVSDQVAGSVVEQVTAEEVAVSGNEILGGSQSSGYQIPSSSESSYGLTAGVPGHCNPCSCYGQVPDCCSQFGVLDQGIACRQIEPCGQVVWSGQVLSGVDLSGDGCHPIGLVVFVDDVVNEVPVVTSESASVIVEPTPIQGVVTEGPGYGESQIYGQVPVYSEAKTNSEIQYPGVPVSSAWTGGITSSTGVFYPAPQTIRAGNSIAPRAVGRVRGFIGGRSFRRN